MLNTIGDMANFLGFISEYLCRVKEIRKTDQSHVRSLSFDHKRLITNLQPDKWSLLELWLEQLPGDDPRSDNL